jgi:hypothetical protein
MKQIDISIPRWMYWSHEVDSLHICPKCKSSLINEQQTYLLALKTKEVESFLIGCDGGYFCPNCPVVVLDESNFASMIGFAAGGNRRSAEFIVMGVVNLDEIPEDKRSDPLGGDDNPIPLVEFLNYENNSEADERKLPFVPVRIDKKKELVNPLGTIKRKSKIGRNAPCPCGSGKKYKKCCLPKEES